MLLRAGCLTESMRVQVHGKPDDARLRVNLQSYETLRPYIFP